VDDSNKAVQLNEKITKPNEKEQASLNVDGVEGSEKLLMRQKIPRKLKPAANLTQSSVSDRRKSPRKATDAVVETQGPTNFPTVESPGNDFRKLGNQKGKPQDGIEPERNKRRGRPPRYV
jgi:hypothetical protein